MLVLQQMILMVHAQDVQTKFQDVQTNNYNADATVDDGSWEIMKVVLHHIVNSNSSHE